MFCEVLWFLFSIVLLCVDNQVISCVNNEIKSEYLKNELDLPILWQDF